MNRGGDGVAVDEDMHDGGNDITDDDYTPSVLPTSPIGRSAVGSSSFNMSLTHSRSHACHPHRATLPLLVLPG